MFRHLKLIINTNNSYKDHLAMDIAIKTISLASGDTKYHFQGLNLVVVSAPPMKTIIVGCQLANGTVLDILAQVTKRTLKHLKMMYFITIMLAARCQTTTKGLPLLPLPRTGMNAPKQQPGLHPEAAGAANSYGGYEEANRSTLRLFLVYARNVYDAFKVQSSPLASSAQPAQHMQITCAESVKCWTQHK